MNNSESDFFLTGKGLRQGDPISPLLFNLIVDALTRMLIKAANQDMITNSALKSAQEGSYVSNMQMTPSSSWMKMSLRELT